MTQSNAIPVTAATEIKPADLRAEAVQVWHDCKTDADRKAAVAKYPILAELYSLAANLK